MNRIFTVGHSNGSQEELLDLLKLVKVNSLIDVRSVPASTYTPQFNKECIDGFLRKNGIIYMHFGPEFGARRMDSIIDGQVNFQKAITTQAFKHGVERINHGLEKGYTICLMCSEANPLSCHRFSLVSRFFYDHGYDVEHILHNKMIKTHKELEDEMIADFLKKRNSKLREIDELFGTYTQEDQRNDAYILKNKEIGYKPSEIYKEGI